MSCEHYESSCLRTKDSVWCRRCGSFAWIETDYVTGCEILFWNKKESWWKNVSAKLLRAGRSGMGWIIRQSS